jgi:4-hydroxy-tetrahydrodipicolinate reductase
MRVALVGLGPIGVEIGRALVGRGVTLSAAADPAFAGRALSEIVEGAPQVSVDSSLAQAVARGVEAVVLATGSRFPSVVPELEAAIAARVHLVSTCEELAAPGPNGDEWRRLDAAARAAGVTLLGSGVNPGFVMDRLVLQLAGACVRVERVTVTRVVDAARRRGPLRKKVGEGLTPEEFADGVRARKLGHVGLAQSAELIARGLGWLLGEYRESIEPVIVDGRCLGLHQIGRGADGKITLDLTMAVGAADPHDAIRIDGDPPIDLRIANGTHGDRGTVGTIVNAVARLARAPRGLVTVADVFT